MPPDRPESAPEPEGSGAGASRRLRQAGRRLGWGLADQAVSSLTNFAIGIYVARSLGAAEFGAFSLAYVTYAFLLNASRGIATDPLQVRFSGTGLGAWRRAVTASAGTATLVGVVAGVCVLGAAALLSGTPQGAFLALGLTVPGLMLQDSWRYAFFALGRGRSAFMNDLVWAGALFAALAALRAANLESVFTFFAAWGGSAAVAAGFGSLQARVVPRVCEARRWVTGHRDLGPRYLVENTALSGSDQLCTYGVGLIAGLAAVGHVRAASMLMGPFLVVFMGISVVAVPEGARLLRRSRHRLRLFCVLLSAGLAAGALGWTGVLLAALPTGLGAWLLGSIWKPAFPLVLPFGLSIVGACAAAGANVGLHALAAARRSLRAEILGSAAYLAFGLAGTLADGAFGAVCGLAIATWLGAVVWWWHLYAGFRESAIEPGCRLPRPLSQRWSTRPSQRHDYPQQSQPLRPGESESA